jgi:hypothetical protein
VRRLLGVAIVLATMGLAFWLALGPPSDWEGVARFIRFGVLLSCCVAFGLAVQLIYPDKPTDETTEGAG